jgi:hypothetical protein
MKLEKKQLNCWIPKSTYSELEARAAKLGLKASAYASLILNACSQADSQGPTKIEAELAQLKQTQQPAPDTHSAASAPDQARDKATKG